MLNFTHDKINAIKITPIKTPLSPVRFAKVNKLFKHPMGNCVRKYVLEYILDGSINGTALEAGNLAVLINVKNVCTH